MATNCALTSDYSLAACLGGAGGIVNVYFIEKSNLSGITKVSGVVTAATKATGKKFRKYELHRKTASWNEDIESSVENGTVGYNQSLTIVLNRNDTALRNEVLLLAAGVVIAVVEDNNGLFWMLGEKGGLTTKGKRGSGTLVNDRNGYELTLEGSEAELAPEVASAVSGALQTAG